MGEIKGQLLGIVATIVTFGIVSSALFIAFDTATADIANDITEKVEYVVSSESEAELSFDNYSVKVDNSNLLMY